MRDLTQGVDTGVRSPRTLNQNRFAGKSLDGVLDDLLYAKTIVLALPPDKGLAIIFNGDPISGHAGVLDAKCRSIDGKCQEFSIIVDYPVYTQLFSFAEFIRFRYCFGAGLPKTFSLNREISYFLRL